MFEIPLMLSSQPFGSPSVTRITTTLWVGLFTR
jgi:hypothetical protein